MTDIGPKRPAVERTVFSTPRSAEFLELKALQAQTGQYAEDFGHVVAIDSFSPPDGGDYLVMVSSSRGGGDETPHVLLLTAEMADALERLFRHFPRTPWNALEPPGTNAPLDACRHNGQLKTSGTTDPNKPRLLPLVADRKPTPANKNLTRHNIASPCSAPTSSRTQSRDRGIDNRKRSE